jgi:hypothetical protein
MSKPIYNKPIYKTRDTIPLNKTLVKYMCLNTHKKAIEIVGYNNPNFNNICWSNISANPSDEAMELLEKNHTKIDSDNLSLNPNDKAIKLLEKYSDKINYDNLSLNTNGKALVLIVDKCPQKINWENVRKNKNVEKSIDLLLDYKKTDKWPSIINNKYVSYLENNELDMIQWEVLAEKMITNPCERGISLIVKHHAIIYTQYSNKNKYMENVSLINDTRIISLLLKYKQSVNWKSLSLNSHDNVFDWFLTLTYNYDKIDYLNLCKNKNDKIVKLLVDTNPTWKNVISELCNDSCKEYKQKCFNELFKQNNDKIIKFLVEKYNTEISHNLYSLLPNSCNAALDLIIQRKSILPIAGVYFKLLAQNENDRAFDVLQEMIDTTQNTSYTFDLTNDCGIYLCKNKNTKVFDFIKKNFHKINLKSATKEVVEAFQNLLSRKDCMDFLEYYLNAERIKNLYLQGSTTILDNLNLMLKWEIISKNPEIFVLDKKEMFNNFEPLKRDIINYPQIKVERLLEKRRRQEEETRRQEEETRRQEEERRRQEEERMRQEEETRRQEEERRRQEEETRRQEEQRMRQEEEEEEESVEDIDMDNNNDDEKEKEEEDSDIGDIDFVISSEEENNQPIENITILINETTEENQNIIQEKEKEETNSDDDNTSNEDTNSIEEQK